jgi:two-component system response regulator MprA
MPANILVVDDTPAIVDAVRRILTVSGYKTKGAMDGLDALEKLEGEDAFDLILLDVMMPKMDGLTFTKTLRAKGDKTPILMLTARTETSDRVAGLDAGADDYMSKPFEMDELLARVRALLRRTQLSEVPEAEVLQVGDIKLDQTSRQCFIKDEEILLTKTEFDLLELLLVKQGQVLTPKEIYLSIWGYDFGPGSKNLAVYVSYLRRKIETDGTEIIHNVRGVGYTIRTSKQKGQSTE